jgi:hypothetical protein
MSANPAACNNTMSKLALFTLNPTAAFSCPATRFMAVVCRNDFVDDFFTTEYGYDSVRASAIKFKCPLMRVFSVQCIGDDYTGSNARFFCFKRIDDICKMIAMPTLSLSSEMQRASLAALLVPIYTPFDEYMKTDAEIADEAFQRHRNGRFTSSLYWYSLHKFLCEEEIAPVETTEEAFQYLADRVRLYIELHKADPRRFTAYWNQGIDIYFDKYCSMINYCAMFPDTDLKYGAKWSEEML